MALAVSLFLDDAWCAARATRLSSAIDERPAALCAHGHALLAALVPLISRSISNSASMRFTASHGDRCLVEPMPDRRTFAAHGPSRRPPRSARAGDWPRRAG